MKRLAQSALFLLLCLALCLLLSPAAFASEGAIVIPDSTTVIEAEAFTGDTGITSVTIPAGVTSIGENAFAGCSGLQEVYYLGTPQQWNAISIGGGNETLSRVIFDDPRFPDPYFRAYVYENFDTDGSGVLSYAERQAVTRINVSGTAEELGLIQSLAGIEYFPNLTFLNCGYNALRTLDLSANTALTDLYAYSNQLAAIDVSSCSALTRLNVRDNQLTALSVSGRSALTDLLVYSNQLTELDVSSCPSLKYLYAFGNRLTGLDLSTNTELIELNINGSQLEALDVTACTKLESLGCDSNKLQTLDLSRNSAMTSLNVCGNQLTSLNVSNMPGLYRLWVQGNSIASIDISACPTIVDAVQNGVKTENYGSYQYCLGDGPFPGTDYSYNFICDTATNVILPST